MNNIEEIAALRHELNEARAEAATYKRLADSALVAYCGEVSLVDTLPVELASKVSTWLAHLDYTEDVTPVGDPEAVVENVVAAIVDRAVAHDWATRLLGQFAELVREKRAREAGQ